MKTTGLCVVLASLAIAPSRAQVQAPLIIPQIVDGGAWSTAIVVTNTGSESAVASLIFFQETGGGGTSSWPLNLMEMTYTQAQALVVPGGSTVFLHTLGTAAATTVGWAQVSELQGAAGAIAAYAIFTQHIGASLQDGTALAAAASSRILVPFDNTGTAVTTMAIANTTTSSESISVGIRTAAGVLFPPPPAITLPVQGHAAFAFPTQFPSTTGQSGMAEFYSASGSFSILALRFQSGAFTTAPVYSVTGPPLFASDRGRRSVNIIVAGFTLPKSNTGGSFSNAGLFTTLLGGQFASYTPAPGRGRSPSLRFH